jgi:hypothetical protein
VSPQNSNRIGIEFQIELYLKSTSIRNSISAFMVLCNGYSCRVRWTLITGRPNTDDGDYTPGQRSAFTVTLTQSRRLRPSMSPAVESVLGQLVP